jgi:DNA-binding beta-propeller fold protein YncE
MRVWRCGWTGVLMLLMAYALVACSGTPTTTPANTATLAVGTPSATFTPMDTPAPTFRATMPATVIAPSPVAPSATNTRAMSPTVAPERGTPTPQTGEMLLLVTNFGARHISWVDPARGVVAQVEVGVAPWGLAVAADGRAYVSTAEGIAVVDTATRRRVALVPYLADVGPPGSGEYRAGGMGIALSPDGTRAYVGVNLPGGNGRLEVLDTAQLRMVGSATVGVRPFDVAVSRDGRIIYSIDHDSFSVTIVDAATLATRTVIIAPAGRDAFAKMHYGVIGPDDRLLLPIMGRALAQLAPSGEFTTTPLSANTHQHGAALTPDGRRLLIVGTGPAGQATGGASLTILDLATGAERILPLARPHEKVAVSPDGRTAYLTGGYTLTGGGWDGITILDLETGTTREVAVPGLPLDVVIMQQ